MVVYWINRIWLQRETTYNKAIPYGLEFLKYPHVFLVIGMLEGK